MAKKLGTKKGGIRKFLMTVGTTVDSDTLEMLKKKFSSVGDLKEAIAEAKEEGTYFSDRGAVTKIIRDTADELNRVDVSGTLLGKRDIERGCIVDVVTDEGQVNGVMISNGEDVNMDDFEQGNDIEFENISASKKSGDFFFYRDNSEVAVSDGTLDKSTYAIDINDIADELVLVNGFIGRTAGTFNSGVESVIKPGGKIGDGNIEHYDVVTKGGDLFLKLYVTNGGKDASVKLKSLDMLTKLINPDDEDEFLLFLKKSNSNDILRMLRDELTGLEVEVFARGSIYAPDGTELKNPWMNMNNWGYIKRV